MTPNDLIDWSRAFFLAAMSLSFGGGLLVAVVIGTRVAWNQTKKGGPR